MIAIIFYKRYIICPLFHNFALFLLFKIKINNLDFMFGIPEIEKKTFNNHFINRVVVAGGYNQNRSCTAQRQSLMDRYAETLPLQTDNPQQQYRINIDVKTNQTSVDANVSDLDHQLTLRSKNMQKELMMTNANFHYQENGTNYGTSVSFDQAVQPALTYLQEAGIEQLNVLKLQKINVIGYAIGKQAATEAPVPVWQPVSNLINARLVPQYEAMMDAVTSIRQHMSNIRLTDGTYTLTIKYGFNVIEKKEDGSMAKGQVIIDLEIERKSPVAMNAIMDELTLMHKELYNAFLWSISEEYVALMNTGKGA